MSSVVSKNDLLEKINVIQKNADMLFIQLVDYGFNDEGVDSYLKDSLQSCIDELESSNIKVAEKTQRTTPEITTPY